MGYKVASKEKVLMPSTTRSTASTFYGAAKDIRGCDDISFTEDVTAAAGTNMTSDLTIQHSHNGVDGWAPLLTFTQRTTAIGAVSETKQASVAGTPVRRFVRTKQVTANTVSITHTVTMNYTRPAGSLPTAR